MIVGDILRLALPLLAGASSFGVLAGVWAFSENPLRIIPALIGLGLCAVSWALMKQGKPLPAVQVLLVGFATSALFAMLFNGGLRVPAATLLLCLVSMAGWVYGRSAATVATLSAIAVAFGVATLSTFSWLAVPTPPVPLLHACFLTIYLSLIWITTALPQQRLRAALNESFERERALGEEQKLRAESDLAFRAVFEHTAHLMILLRPDGEVVDVNRAALAFLSGGREAVVGKPLVQAGGWQELARERLGEALGRAVSAKAEPVRLELQTGETPARTFEFTFSPSRGEQDTLRYVIVEGRDVSVHREAQKQEHRARRLELVGQLAGGVAHDFNNVLAAILSSSEMIKSELKASGPMSVDVQDGLDTISSAGLRAADLTRRLLTFARRTPIEKRIVSMNEILGSTVKLLTRLLPPNIKLVTTLGALRDTVDAAPASVESMLLNLAINARDAMPSGGSLTFSTAEVPMDDGWRRATGLELREGSALRVSVTDTGCGIAPGLLERIFEPFFTTKPEGQGGSELALELLAASPRLRVLLVSGFPRDADLSALPKDRAQLLSKPFTAESFHDALLELLPGPRAVTRS